ncbi:transcriptional regulator [Clostridia bacterium]|nr:transcriptional regulator [Clostridia bacterium]
MTDLMDFLKDDTSATNSTAKDGSNECWKIMVIDDEPSIHDVTHYALRRFGYMDKGLKILDAFSAKQAELIVESEKDLALLLVDVVMETDDAGLKFIRWFRDMNINPCTRIILRTGQPGQAPEEEIIVNYDLHDYKTKTELTSEKLFTSLVSGLRSYRDMCRLEQTKIGLENIITSTSMIMRVQSMYDYARAVLQQIGSIFDIRSRGIVCAHHSYGQGWSFLAEYGTFHRSPREIEKIFDSIGGSGEYTGDGCLASLLYQSDVSRYAVYLETNEPLNDIQSRMLLLFSHNVSVGLSNIKLYDGLIRANRVTVMSLAQVTESRDHSTGEHVFRIAKAVELLTDKMIERGMYEKELTEDIVSVISLASTLHDIGKISVSDTVLLKPGKLTPEEFEQIKLHTVNGANVLDSIQKGSVDRIKYLDVGKDIALGHHERWDGNGYPHKVGGMAIPIAARITSIVDVFDALTHARCYKPPFELDEALGIIADDKGKAFDPKIADLFLTEVAKLVVAEEQKSKGILLS